MLKYIPKDLIINAKVAMNQSISETDNAIPGNLGMVILKSVR